MRGDEAAPTKQSFGDKCVPKLELGNEGHNSGQLMKNCIFCGEPGGSREHIIATAVQKRMKLSAVKIEVGVREEDGDGDFRKAHGLNEFVTKKVCTACNTGWMSQLEVDFLAVTGHLIEPEWPKLENDFIHEAVRRSDVIARWALKTAVTANIAGIIKRPIPDEIPTNLRLGKLPERLFIKLAHIRKHEAIKVIINRGFWFVDTNPRKWRGAASGKSFDVLFQLNHLAIRAINAPGAELGFDAPDKNLPISAFPPAYDSCWSGYSFASLEDFEKRLVARIPIAKTT